MTRKAVLLVRAEIPNRVRDQFIPNGLLCLSEALEKSGYEPSIIDMRVQNYRRKLQSVDWDSLLAFGISTLTGPQILHGLAAARFARRMRPDLPIIWGGPHATLCPEETARHELCDIVVRNDGEATIVELMDRISKGIDYGDVDGITYLRNEEMVSTKNREWTNLDTLGFLPYHLLDIGKYDLESSFVYHSSRGCPHDCAFCTNHAFNRGSYRAQSPGRFVDNIEHIINTFGVRKFYFSDDNFMVSKKRVEGICQELIRRKLNITWLAACRFDYFSRYSETFLSLLVRSGCKQLSYGAESGSLKILELIKKQITPDDVLISVRRAVDAGIILSPISFMYGFPGETKEDLNQTLDLIDHIRAAGKGNTIVNGIFLLTPYPGTPITDTLKKLGYSFPTSLEDWANYLLGSGHQKRVTWLSKNYLRRATAASNIVRFRYFMSVNAGRKLSSPILRFLYRIFVLPFLLSERIRWKFRFFAFPIEWELWSTIKARLMKVT